MADEKILTVPLSKMAAELSEKHEMSKKLAGELLVDGVLKQIRNEQVPTALLPAKLIVRQSCGAH